MLRVAFVAAIAASASAFAPSSFLPAHGLRTRQSSATGVRMWVPPLVSSGPCVQSDPLSSTAFYRALSRRHSQVGFSSSRPVFNCAGMAQL